MTPPSVLFLGRRVYLGIVVFPNGACNGGLLDHGDVGGIVGTGPRWRHLILTFLDVASR